MTDLLALAGPIPANVEIPVLADIEDWKGTAMHFCRGIQLFERAGIAGVLVERRRSGPHMGAPKGGLVTTAQMADKIHAAVDARRDPNFVIVVASVGLREGRTMNEVFDRAAAYEQAGADAFWFPGLVFKDNIKAADVVKKPLMSTQGTLAELTEAKVAFAAILDFGMISLGAARRALQKLTATGAIPNATRLHLTSLSLITALIAGLAAGPALAQRSVIVGAARDTMLVNSAPASGLITRQDIDAWAKFDLADVFRRARLLVIGDIALCPERGTQEMTEYLDGAPIFLDPKREDGPGISVRRIPPQQIEAIEVYRSIATRPVEFNATGSKGCLILIWTRR